MLYELHARMHALTFHQVTAQAVIRPYPNLSLISRNASTFPSCADHRSNFIQINILLLRHQRRLLQPLPVLPVIIGRQAVLHAVRR